MVSFVEASVILIERRLSGISGNGREIFLVQVLDRGRMAVVVDVVCVVWCVERLGRDTPGVTHGINTGPTKDSVRRYVGKVEGVSIPPSRRPYWVFPETHEGVRGRCSHACTPVSGLETAPVWSRGNGSRDARGTNRVRALG